MSCFFYAVLSSFCHEDTKVRRIAKDFYLRIILLVDELMSFTCTYYWPFIPQTFHPDSPDSYRRS